MIPILYESNETVFNNNGLCRLPDCVSVLVTEERNGIYECDFEVPVTGKNFEYITLGRIIAVTHDDTGDVQYFDIVSYSKPINGIVTFHAVHISYRQSFITVKGSGINSLSAALTLLKSAATPSNPFNYYTDKTNTGYLAAADGIPKTVRSMLGGVEGSILDTYGGEFKWDRFNVSLLANRGINRNFNIRYGVNMKDFTDESDASETYSAVIPYWTDGSATVVGDRQTSGATITGRGETVPLDVSDKFETKPTKAQVEAMGLSVLKAANSALPAQTIKVSFVRLQDAAEFANFAPLLQCELCDTIGVTFPEYNISGRFKIVKTVWDVLRERFNSMELGTLSTTLSEALGISSGNGPVADPFAGNVTIGGNLTVNGTATISGLLSPAAISAGLFSVSEHTASLDGTAAGNRTATASATKSGYYPLGVVGELVSTSGAYSRGFYLTSRAQGSATVNYRIYATGSGAKSCTAYVLWVKNTA